MAGGEPAGGLGNGEGSRADAVENRSGVVDRVRPLPIRGSCRRQRVGARGPAPPCCPESDRSSACTLHGPPRLTSGALRAQSPMTKQVTGGKAAGLMAIGRS
jgi:hypothetical protein